MPNTNSSASISRTLRLAALAEVVFLAVSVFFLFTEHRAHYLGVLPYALLILALTVFLLLIAERRSHRVVAADRGTSQRPKGGQFHAR